MLTQKLLILLAWAESAEHTEDEEDEEYEGSEGIESVLGERDRSLTVIMVL